MSKIYVNPKTGQTSLNIPKSLARAKGFYNKQEVEWVIDNLGQLILRPK
jgi:antitoxin component of MazEF toxin-antitoxin module